MKVLLINSPSGNKSITRDMAGGLGLSSGETVVLPPLELAYMAATLLNKGHEAKIVDSDIYNYSNSDIYQIVKEYSPDTVIATVSLPTIYNDCSFINEIRKHSKALVITKTGITYPPILKEILEKSQADLCIYGESDINILEIIKREDKKGTAYINNREFIVEEKNFIEDLNKLPLPARNLLDNEKYKYVLLGDKVTIMQTSRGCPFPCSYYCAYPMVQGKTWRSRNPEHVLQEIEDIVNNYKINKILFRDATFTFNKSRVDEICEQIIKKNLQIEWWCETRVDCLNEELMCKMKKAGCKGMNIGVETGDSEIMQKQAKIGLTLEKLKKIRDLAKKIGLKLHFLLMVGLPDETKKSLYDTYILISKLNPESIGMCIITPYPGTPLYMEAKEKGWIETEDWARFGGSTPIMHTDNLKSQDLLKARELFIKIFYSSKKSFIGWIRGKFLIYQFKKWIF